MILFIGNMLSKQGLSPAMSELLAFRLGYIFNVKSVSGNMNPLLRLTQMLVSIYRDKQVIKLVIIDVFSSKSFWYTVMCAFLCRRLKLPYITILRGGNLPARLSGTPKLCRAIFNNSAANISPSDYLKLEFIKHGFHVEVIPNFIDLDKYPFVDRIAISPKLLWVRAFHEIYNPKLAIEIILQLRNKYPDTKLCMVGPEKDGSMDEIKSIVRIKGLENVVQFTGKLSKAEWIKISRQYDIFINTTNFDNMPVSVIEGMALGLPVVSTNVGGISHLIDDNKTGLLVNKNSVTDFVNAIQKLLEDNNFAHRIAIAARERVTTFDWSVVEEQWKDIILRYQKQ